MLNILNILKLLFKETSIFPLVTFRVLFGLMMFFSVIRFWLNGWIESQYIDPSFHFKFYGFSWIQEPPTYILYGLFILSAISALGIALGLFYRICTILFFLCFSYIELIDATYYLNHYYFVSLVSLFLVFIPANGNVSLDVLFKIRKPTFKILNWHLWGIMFLLSIVYFYAGLAKLNYDWLVNALPLKIWLAPHTNIPVFGSLMDNEVTAYLMSWGGALFDLSVPFLLLFKKTRKTGYFFVVIFHLFTAYLFPIGIFPYVMIVSTTIFFAPHFHEKIWTKTRLINQSNTKIYPVKHKKLITYTLALFFIFQLLFPFRYLAYNDNLFWTEQGYRFSWRVMLMEKAGYAQFKVYPKNNNQYIIINNSDYLTPQQEKMMSTQPDFILQYAHFLSSQYKTLPSETPKVTADVFVSLNGEGSRRFVKENIDLTTKTNSFKPIDWIEKY